MGLGEALMEEMSYRGNRFGVHKIPSMLDYKSLTTMEMPDVETYLISDPDRNGPYGAKEAGQGPAPADDAGGRERGLRRAPACASTRSR